MEVVIYEKTLCNFVFYGWFSDWGHIYIDRKDGKGIEVLFERACDGGFDDLCMRLDCSVISRKGYTDDEVEFLKKVLEGCKDTIAEEALIA